MYNGKTKTDAAKKPNRQSQQQCSIREVMWKVYDEM